MATTNMERRDASQSYFPYLLAALGEDSQAAGLVYEHLRVDLINFFRRRECQACEDLADETFERVGWRLYRGVCPRNLPKYCFGAARRLFAEGLLERKRRRAITVEDFRLALPPNQIREQEQRAREEVFVRLDNCLAQLPAAERELVLDYYRVQDGPTHQWHKEMVQRLGITPNNLGVKIHRSRRLLKSLMIRTEEVECVR